MGTCIVRSLVMLIAWGGLAVAQTVPPPQSLQPEANASNVALLPSFVWTAVLEAASYDLQVSTGDAFTELAVDITGLTDTAFIPDTPLTPGTVYHWRVRAVGASEASLWSPSDQGQSFTTVPPVPPAPGLLTPADGAVGVEVLPLFRWQRAEWSEAYTVQVSPDSAFGTDVREETGVQDTLLTMVVPLDSAVRYYWRVRGINGSGDGAWSLTSAFTTTGDPPSPPALLSPVDQASDIWPDTVLTWEPVAHATGYAVQLSTDPAFPASVQETLGVAEPWLRIAGLARNTTHYWRVQAVNAVGASTWSAAWSFLTVPEVPEAPLLLFPGSGATEVTNPPTFRWTQSERSVTYELQVAFKTDFTDDSLIIAESGLTDTTFTPAFIMDGGSTFNWRIRGVNAGGPGAWSAGWSFTTKLEAPSSVPLYTPEDGATGRLSIVILGWWATTDNPADSYHLQVSTDSLFGRLAVDVAGITGTERIVTGLAYSETYYWRVNASNRVGTGPWSPFWRFSTRAGSPRAPSPTIPADAATGLPLTPLFAWIPGGGEDSFTLQVALTSNFASPVVNVTGITDTSYTVSSPLQGSTVHYWRVRAVNASGSSSWTTVRSFTTLLPPPGVTVALPADSITAGSFRARWIPVAGATSYELDVSADSLFVSFLPGYEDLGLSDTSHVVSGLEPGMLYFYRVRAVHAGGTGPSSEVMRVLLHGVMVRLRAYLSGPFTGDTMRTTLRQDGVLPLAQPYAAEPWAYDGTEQVDSLPPRVVDWVLLEVRADSVTLIGRAAALLLADGTITGLDGQSPVFMPDIAAGPYFIVLRHRNHLAVMSAEAIALSMTSALLDLTTGADRYYGGDANVVAPGVYALWCGDVTANGQVKYSGSGNDRSPILTCLGGADLTLMLHGYHGEDVNMDGQVKYSGSGNDRSLILQTIGGSDMTVTRTTRVPNP